MTSKLRTILYSILLAVGLWTCLCAPLQESVAVSAPGPATMGTVQAPARIHRLPVAGLPTTGDFAQYVLKPADIPKENWQRGHRGVDIQAKPGDEIVASAAGTVAFAGVVAGTPTVSVDHQSGVRTTYEPVRAVVHKGQRVRRGELIGVLVDTAQLPETARRDPGLSWGAKIVQGRSAKGRAQWLYVDPLELIGSAVVRLLPLGAENVR